MTNFSVSSEPSLAQFNLIVLFSVAIAIIILLLLFFKHNNTLLKSTVYSLVAFLGIYYTGYNAKLNRFHKVTTTEKMIYLEHVGASNNTYVLPDEIESITFGVSHRSAKGCYISINLHSGKKYRSVSITEEVDVCKVYRRELISTFSSLNSEVTS